MYNENKHSMNLSLFLSFSNPSLELLATNANKKELQRKSCLHAGHTEHRGQAQQEVQTFHAESNPRSDTELEHKFFRQALLKLASNAKFSGNCQVACNISAAPVIERFAKVNKTDFS